MKDTYIWQFYDSLDLTTPKQSSYSTFVDFSTSENKNMATMSKKQTFSEWSSLMYIANNSKGTSPILGIHYNSQLISPSFAEIPFFVENKTRFSQYSEVGSFIRFSGDRTVTTAIRLEAVLLRLVTKTDFNKIEDLNKIVLGRYVVNANGFPLSLMHKLFNYIISSKSQRINKSWLVPLQEWILEFQIPKPEKKSKRLKKSEDKFISPSVKETGEQYVSKKSWYKIHAEEDNKIPTPDRPEPYINPNLPKKKSTGGYSIDVGSASKNSENLFSKALEKRIKEQIAVLTSLKKSSPIYVPQKENVKKLKELYRSARSAEYEAKITRVGSPNYNLHSEEIFHFSSDNEILKNLKDEEITNTNDF